LKSNVIPKPSLQQVRDLRENQEKFALGTMKFLHSVQDDRCTALKKNNLLSVDLSTASPRIVNEEGLLLCKPSLGQGKEERFLPTRDPIALE